MGGKWSRVAIDLDSTSTYYYAKKYRRWILDTREFPECVPKLPLFNVPSTFEEIFDVALVRPSSLELHKTHHETREGKLADILGYYFYFGLRPFL